ncbi:F-box/WD40 repeat-containing protein [Parendozoicomonas sp. Alg238-R29]|uniref:F-box/WD repeat-containing protein n=1 Tax=Parendozoicomonas sp. Alg238-R29 TaxID=2993446 RepID=UPI00248E92B4|nr:F-box/WD40 repeat-containing protein [Parendozoicomonas sp. Alg238-R29]
MQLCFGDLLIANEEATDVVSAHDVDDIENPPLTTPLAGMGCQAWGRGVEECPPILRLPPELLCHLFSFTSLRERIRLCHTCKQLNAVHATPYLLKRQIFNLYPDVYKFLRFHGMALHTGRLKAVNEATGRDWTDYSPEVHFIMARYLNLIHPPEKVFKELKEHARGYSITSASWSPNGHYLASAGTDGRCNVWNLDKAENHELIYMNWDSSGNNEVMSVSWHPEGKLLAAGFSNGYIKIIEPLTDLKIVHSFKAHQDTITSVSWRPDGSCFASGSCDSTIKMWAPDKDDYGNALPSLKGNLGRVTCLAWCSDNRRLASGSDNAKTTIWDTAKTGSERFVTNLLGHEDTVTQVAWSYGARLATCSRDGSIRAWNLSQEAVATLICTIRGHKNFVTGLSWSSRGFLASCALDKTVKMWDVDLAGDNKCLGTIESKSQFKSLAWHPDGQRLATGNREGEILVLDEAP